MKCLTEFFYTRERHPNTEEISFQYKKSTSDKPWVTEEIQQLVAEKHRYFDYYKVKQSAESFESFKKYRNLVNRKLKEPQNQFPENSLKKY